MAVLSSIYAGIARRRRWRTRRPARRLERPVVSVGALAVGGSGKTPAAAHVAGVLAEAGYRPAILSRGYARRVSSAGVTVVSDGRRIVSDLDHAGDEPLMLARQLPGVPVLVSRDRYSAGRLAETELGCTVHVLDDGFQHVGLARDIDLVLLSPEDAARPLTLPGGRLREPLDALRAASAVIVDGAPVEAVQAICAASGVADVFALERETGAAQPLGGADAAPVHAARTRIVAVAGVARPGRFFEALEAAGWVVAGRLRFPDHHRFTRADMEAIARAAREARADLVLTTEKDAVRMEPLARLPVQVAWVPLRVRVEPSARFAAWMTERLANRRTAQP